MEPAVKDYHRAIYNKHDGDLCRELQLQDVPNCVRQSDSESDTGENAAGLRCCLCRYATLVLAFLLVFRINLCAHCPGRDFVIEIKG